MKNSLSRDAMCMKAFEVIGDKYTLAIIYLLNQSDERFCGLERKLQLNPITLTNRLKKLEGLKLVKRTKGSSNKISVTYSLTPLGKEVQPVMDKLESFASKL